MANAVDPRFPSQIKEAALQQGYTYVNSADAASYLGIADRTLKLWRKQGRSPRFKKVNSEIRYEFSDMDRWLEGSYVEAKA